MISWIVTGFLCGLGVCFAHFTGENEEVRRNKIATRIGLVLASVCVWLAVLVRP
jgi:hypothetical protein